MNQTLRAGTRGSELALRQTREIIALLRRSRPGLDIEIVEITTHGDRFQDVPIADMGQHIDRGIFNSALEEAVLEERVDFATCSFKDVESELPPGLKAVSVGRRVDARDVLVTPHGTPLSALPEGATLATSSPRRKSQLQAFRPDFRFHPLRGNVATRLDAASGENAKFDGVIVAGAGLIRMGLEDRIAEWIAPEILLPAAAQAAMGCEYHSERGDIAELIASIQDEDTELCARAEKQLLVTLSGGCFAPIGVLAEVEAGMLRMRCRIVSLDGREKAEAEAAAPRAEAEHLVAGLAENLSAQGARQIIGETRTALQKE